MRSTASSFLAGHRRRHHRGRRDAVRIAAEAQVDLLEPAQVGLRKPRHGSELWSAVKTNAPATATVRGILPDRRLVCQGTLVGGVELQPGDGVRVPGSRRGGWPSGATAIGLDRVRCANAAPAPVASATMTNVLSIVTMTPPLGGGLEQPYSRQSPRHARRASRVQVDPGPRSAQERDHLEVVERDAGDVDQHLHRITLAEDAALHVARHLGGAGSAQRPQALAARELLAT